MCSRRSTELGCGVLAAAVLFAVPVMSQQADETAAAVAGPQSDLPGQPTVGQIPQEEITPEEKREVEEMLGMVQAFQQQTKTYKKEIQLIIERKYEEQRKAVVGSYERSIKELEREENQRRLQAIEVFERFLAKYPDDPRYTPGVLWRLAELYFEKAKLEYARAEDAFDQKLMAYNRGETKVEPMLPMPHFEGTVSLLQRLVRDFPDYKLLDGAYYLLAYCLQEQGESDEAEAAYLAFVERFPNSRYLPEVYTRLGESYFTDPHKLDKAIAAYKRVLDHEDSRMWDKALYKLAWTYYRIDRFDEAVERFDQLIAWADSGDPGEEDIARTELRAEAMQYLAVCFAEDEWEGSGIANAKEFLARRNRPYQDEFFRKLGEVNYQAAKYDRSIQAFEEAVRLNPTHPDNPKLMSTVVDAYYRLQDPEGAARAQEKLVKAFGPGSRWREANQDDPEVVGEADKLAKNALNAAAVRHHVLAQRLKQEEQVEQAQREYALAASLYADYLERFPGSKDAYQLNFYLAECYYYSLRFEKAAEAYAKVRDSAAGTEHRAEAANSVVLSYINLTKQAEKAGEIEPLKLYTSKDRPDDLPIEPRPIPSLRQKLIAACDAYVEKLPADEQTGNMQFRAARILYAYDHLDKARERFSRIVAGSSDDDLVTSSINLIIESYLVTKDWEQVETWSRKLASLSRDPQQKEVLREFELGARFNRATELMKTGEKLLKDGNQVQAQARLDAAAKEFIRLVDDNPRGKTSDKALNNAALCYTWSNRPVSAGKIYARIVEQYPQSEFADKALFLMAGSAEASYHFDRAIDIYLRLVNNYPKSELRVDALYNAAVDLEDDQQYRRAAKAYERYATLFPDRTDAASNFFRAGVMYEKEKAWGDVRALFGRFIRTYGRDASQRERLVMAHMKIAESWAASGNARKARQGYNDTIKLFQRYRLEPGGRAAEAAAKARFLLAEHALESYEAITFNVRPRLLKKTLDRKARILKQMEERYKQVWQYKRVQWTLAAYYRLGYLYQNFADVLVNAPCPKGLNMEECDIYKGKLMDWAEAPIKKAVSAYVDTMEKSKELKLVNEWTRKAYKSLNRFEPLQYPMQKEPREALVMDRFGPQPMLRLVESGIKPSGK